MVRPPQYERPKETNRDATAIRAAIKNLAPRERTQLIAWLLLYYQDDGSMFSREGGRRRTRITINGVEFWLARVPKRDGRVR